MIKKFKEVYEDRSAHTIPSMSRARHFSTRDVYINPEHVVCLRLDDKMSKMIRDNQNDSTISSGDKFTRIFMNRGQSGIDIVVKGTPDQIERALRPATTVLKG